MNQLNAVVSYLKSLYPDWDFKKVDIDSETTATHIPDESTKEADAFNAGWDAGKKEALDIYRIKLLNFYVEVNKYYQKAYEQGSNEGFANGNEQGFGQGVEAELLQSVIPSDAFDIEVFAVKPTSDNESGLQAFVGYKVPHSDLEGSDFHFIQIPYNAPKK